MKDAAWYPYASGLGWGLLVLVLVLVNSGNLLLSIVLAAFVAVLSHRLAVRAQRPAGSAER